MVSPFIGEKEQPLFIGQDLGKEEVCIWIWEVQSSLKHGGKQVKGRGGGGACL